MDYCWRKWWSNRLVKEREGEWRSECTSECDYEITYYKIFTLKLCFPILPPSWLSLFRICFSIVHSWYSHLFLSFLLVLFYVCLVNVSRIEFSCLSFCLAIGHRPSAPAVFNNPKKYTIFFHFFLLFYHFLAWTENISLYFNHVFNQRFFMPLPVVCFHWFFGLILLVFVHLSGYLYMKVYCMFVCVCVCLCTFCSNFPGLYFTW